MRDVFKAMGNFETAFEKMYQITLNEAMIDRKSTRLNSSHVALSRMPSSA